MTNIGHYCARKCYIQHKNSNKRKKEDRKSNIISPNQQQKYRNSNNNSIETLNSYPLRTKEQLNLTLVPNRVAYYHISKKKVSKEVHPKYVRAK
ncbi:hypothetical protein PFBG_06140 [Plasmodium falciparum 7G8]|uniref:Uncharacterized protein n=1 Tax=Plasmodium falciparum (isolate 7G8) TaxID=57266 RepID=W7F2I9_PLAF8|nr:hypothetical protein PFBG_06140 [Plasmodium falciparum 7G8]